LCDGTANSRIHTFICGVHRSTQEFYMPDYSSFHAVIQLTITLILFYFIEDRICCKRSFAAV